MIEVQKASPLPQARTQPRATRVVAHIISYIFHPVFFPVVMAIVIWQLAPAAFAGIPHKQLTMWFLSIGLTAVFFPLFSILLMKQLGFIESYLMPTARDRTIPLMAIMIFYFWVSHVFNSLPVVVPLQLKVLLLGNFWGIIALFMINIFTKISMHTSAAGGMVGIIIVMMCCCRVNMVVPLFVAIALAGIIGTARMSLGAHQKGDVWLGYIIGILSQVLAYWYMK